MRTELAILKVALESYGVKEKMVYSGNKAEVKPAGGEDYWGSVGYYISKFKKEGEYCNYENGKYVDVDLAGLIQSFFGEPYSEDFDHTGNFHCSLVNTAEMEMYGVHPVSKHMVENNDMESEEIMVVVTDGKHYACWTISPNDDFGLMFVVTEKQLHKLAG